MKKKWKRPKMVHGMFTKYKWIPFYPKNILLCRDTDIGALCLLFAQEGIYIGPNVQIGARTTIYTKNTENNTAGPVTIRAGAKIGAHCLIFPKVIIEKQEKIPAGSIVFINKENERVIKR